MTALRVVAIVFILIGGLIAHLPVSAQTSDVPSGMLKADVKLSAVRRPQDNGLMLRGFTNLPDGTKLYLGLIAPNGTLVASLPTVVAGGAFQAGPYNFQGKAIPPGAYTVSVDSAAPGQQPSNVQIALGKRGEKMTGPLVKAQREGRRVVTTIAVNAP